MAKGDDGGQGMKQSEHQVQVQLFEWAELQSGKYPELQLLNGSLNGVRLRIGQAVKAKKAGMKRGYPDIFLPIRRGQYSGLFIELKVDKNKPSLEQRDWISALRGQGYKAEVCWGFDEAKDMILNYVGGKK